MRFLKSQEGYHQNPPNYNGVASYKYTFCNSRPGKYAHNISDSLLKFYLH